MLVGQVNGTPHIASSFLSTLNLFIFNSCNGRFTFFLTIVSAKIKLNRNLDFPFTI